MTTTRKLVSFVVLLGLGLGSAAEATSGGLPAGQVAAKAAASTEPSAPAGHGARCSSLLGCGADLQAAVDLERKISDNLWYGLALPIDYNTPERIPGDVKAIDPAWGDAGIWSGNYLAAESFRYALARRKLQTRDHGPREDNGSDRLFWAAQQAEAKGRIDAMAAQVDLRTNIAREWKTEFSPSVDPSRTPPVLSFGGGVVSGEPGMLMYSCAPTNAAAGFGMPRNSDVRGPWHWTNQSGRPARLAMPEGDYLCEASTSRDAYAGTLFGLLTAFDLVSADDPAMRSLIRDDVLSIADYLLRHGWNWVRPEGNVLGNNFFVTPLMVISPTYRLGITQAARHVAEVAGPATEVAKWTAVWAEEFASQAGSDVVADEVNDPSPTADYYGWNLAHLMYYDLVRLAANPAEKASFRTNFSIIDRQTSDDVNAFFETVTYTMTGERSRLDAAVAHLREWRGYRARIDQGGVTNNTARCGTAIECVPQDQYDLVLNGPAGETRVTVPGSSTTLRAVQPLPVAQRPPADFLWQRSPFTRIDGSVSAAHQEPGIDYLLPYWMLRYYTELAPPPLDPLRVWPGPAYSGS